MIPWTNIPEMLKTSDLEENEIITFLDEGQWIDSKFTKDDGTTKRMFVMHINYKGEEANIKVNKYSYDELSPKHGTDTKDWVGKTAKITKEYVRSLKVNMIVLVPTDKEPKHIPSEDTAWEGEGT